MHLGRQPAGRLGLAGLFVAGVLAVTFGTGYTATRALSDNGSVWLRKGDTVAQINSPARRLEATVKGSLVASPGSALDVFQEPDGTVWLAVPGGGRLYRLDQSTMAPGEPISGNAVLVGSGVAYAIDWKQGTVTPLNPATGRPSGTAIKVGGVIQSQVLIGKTAYVVTDQDQVVTVTGTTKGKPQQVARQNEQVTLAVAGSTPVVVDATTGQVTELTGSRKGISLPGVAASSLQVASHQPGPNLWLVRGTQLIAFDLGSGATHTASLPSSGHYEAPVVVGGRAYVPNQAANSVAVYGTNDLAPVHTFALPAGAPGNPGGIEVVAKEGVVWADTPSAQNALVLTGGGTRSQTVDKGTGKDVVNPAASGRPTSGSRPGGPPAQHPTTPKPPPVDQPPIVDPSTPVTPVTPSGTTPPASGTTPVTDGKPSADGQSTVTVPTINDGELVDAACAKITAAHLACNRKADGTGVDANLVTGQNPDGGTQVQSGSLVTVDYNPASSSSSPPTGTGGTGNPGGGGSTGGNPTDPGGGTPVTPPVNPPSDTGSTAPAQVHAPNCIGADQRDTSGCANGMTINPVAQASDIPMDCNKIYSQSPPVGQLMDPTQAVTVYFDTDCLQPLSLFTETNKTNTKGQAVILQYLTTSGSDSAQSNNEGYLGDVFQSPKANGSTVALHDYIMTGGSGSSTSAQYYHSFSGSQPPGSWSDGGIVGYVYTAPPPDDPGNDLAEVYWAKGTDMPYAEATYAFSTSCGSLGIQGTPAWYAPYTSSPDTSPGTNGPNICTLP